MTMESVLLEVVCWAKGVGVKTTTRHAWVRKGDGLTPACMLKWATNALQKPSIRVRGPGDRGCQSCCNLVGYVAPVAMPTMLASMASA